MIDGEDDDKKVVCNEQRLEVTVDIRHGSSVRSKGAERLFFSFESDPFDFMIFTMAC
jgi:hypothetical protein